jgi:mRNA interferase MazF
MTRYKIVLVRFPFDDLSSTKVRPTLCLTEPLGTRRYVLVAFISSQVPSLVEATDVVIDDQHAEFAQTGLHVTSVVSLQRVLSVPENLILRELGVLPQSLQEQVKAKLAAILL